MGKKFFVNRRANLAMSFLVSLAMVVSGVMLFFQTENTLSVLAVIIGIGILIASIRSFLVSREMEDPSLKSSMVTKSVIMAIAAVVMIAFPSILYRANIYLWRFVIYVAAFALIVLGVLTIAQAILFKPEGWGSSLVFEGLAFFIAGIALLPGVVTRFLGDFVLKLLGIALVVLGVCYFVSSYNKRYDLKEI